VRLAESKATLENGTGEDNKGKGRFSEGTHEIIDDLILAIKETAKLMR